VTEEGEMAAEARRGGDFPVGMKVLVVDDDPTSLLVLKRMLDECRYDGKQAAPHPHPAITRLPLVQGNSEMPYC
jgi:hypothetical protein